MLIVDTFHHIPERVAYFTRLRRSIKPGGQLVIVDFRKDAPSGPAGGVPLHAGSDHVGVEPGRIHAGRRNRTSCLVNTCSSTAKQSADRSRPTGAMEQLWQDLRVAARGLLKDRAFSCHHGRHPGAVPGGEHRHLRGGRRRPAQAAAVRRARSAGQPSTTPIPAPAPPIADNGVPGLLRPPRGASRRSRAWRCTAQNGTDDRRRHAAMPSALPGAHRHAVVLQVLRVEAFRGRVFTEEEAEVGQDQKVLLTHGYWQRQFGGADSALGQIAARQRRADDRSSACCRRRSGSSIPTSSLCGRWRSRRRSAPTIGATATAGSSSAG